MASVGGRAISVLPAEGESVAMIHCIWWAETEEESYGSNESHRWAAVRGGRCLVS